MTEKTRYIPVTKWDQYHPWPTVAALRNIILPTHENGSDSFVVRYGKRILIDEKEFFNWLKKQGDKKND